mmetsp:Transcript_19552/g.36125  ORF Transcript_19552/g.36125 Transcript_19552/m.36125 type:complete len:514 (+) Transcript_19552:638-2179(+)
MLCSISGQMALSPVFCAKTGLIYEDRLIRKALETSGGKCPVTGTEINAETDLVPIKTSHIAPPRAPDGNSFPAVLNTLQNEWDSILLEQIQLRKELQETRKDLATALYEREAASAVIARLLKENDELKAALESGSGVKVKTEATTGMETEEGAADWKAILEETSAGLFSHRQAYKPVPGEDGLANLSANNWSKTQEMAPHGTSKPGVTCLSLPSFNVAAGEQPCKHLVTGGADGTVKLVNLAVGQIAGNLSKHKGAVTDVCLNGQVVTSASKDKTVEVWSGQLAGPDNEAEHDMTRKHIFTLHTKAATACPLHTSGRLCATAGLDAKWNLVDIHSGETCVTHTFADAQKIHVARFHPDGKLLGLGSDSNCVTIFDVSADPANGPPAPPFDHGAAVRALAFSENGYFMASAGDDGTAKVWDLRKRKVVTELVCATEQATATSVQFDSSGCYLALGDSLGGVAISQKPRSKKGAWESVVKLFDHSKPIMGLGFLPSAKGLWTASMDRSIKLFAEP